MPLEPSCPSCAAAVEPGALACPRCRTPLASSDDVTRLSDADETRLAAAAGSASRGSRQTAIGTFVFVMLRALLGMVWPATALTVLLFAAVIFAESGFENTPLMVVVIVAIITPVLFVFLRFGLVSLVMVLLVNQVLANSPLTADLAQSHAAIGVWTLLALLALAWWTFHLSKAGRGMWKGLAGGS